MPAAIQKIRPRTFATFSPPAPMTGETQSEFFVRAMHDLQSVIPALNRRTQEVLRIWCGSDSDRDLRDKARDQFSVETFQHFDPRCVFVEHTIPAGGQQPEMHYGREELQQMVDWANYRIRNADTFAVISDGHTPTQSELVAGRPMPDVLGYAGPFYLGQLGDVNPHWAIYADEWIHRTDLARYAKRQRRSPEVWIDEPIERRTMDPIAALGAETPRLDCGMNPYSRAGDGQTVMSYSAMSFGLATAVSARKVGLLSAEPGGELNPLSAVINSSPAKFHDPVPGRVSGTHYSKGELTMPLSTTVPAQDQAAAGRVDPRVLEQTVLKAVAALLPSIVRTVQQQLSGEFDGESAASENDEDSAEAGFDVDGSRDPEASGALDASDLSDQPGEAASLRYAALSDECRRAYRAGWKQGQISTQRYSRGDDLHQVVARQQMRLQELGDQIARERRDASRYSKLNELSREFAFDPCEEAETCRDMSDKQFERHCTATIIKYARRDDVTNLTLFTDPTVSVDRYGAGASSRANIEQIERYSREAAALAARKNAVKRGSTTFAAEFDAICQQHGISV